VVLMAPGLRSWLTRRSGGTCSWPCVFGKQAPAHALPGLEAEGVVGSVAVVVNSAAVHVDDGMRLQAGAAAAGDAQESFRFSTAAAMWEA
jgi:hypothetical protein